jgi:hypothetical protein
MVNKRRSEAEYFDCPHCGAEVRVGSSSCRECGSDAETGWSEDALLWQADIPTASGDADDDFDYDEFIAREFPGQADVATRPSIRGWVTGGLVFGVVLAFLLWSLSG